MRQKHEKDMTNRRKLKAAVTVVTRFAHRHSSLFVQNCCLVAESYKSAYIQEQEVVPGVVRVGHISAREYSAMHQSDLDIYVAGVAQMRELRPPSKRICFTAEFKKLPTTYCTQMLVRALLFRHMAWKVVFGPSGTLKRNQFCTLAWKWKSSQSWSAPALAPVQSIGKLVLYQFSCISSRQRRSDSLTELHLAPASTKKPIL